MSEVATGSGPDDTFPKILLRNAKARAGKVVIVGAGRPQLYWSCYDDDGGRATAGPQSQRLRRR